MWFEIGFHSMIVDLCDDPVDLRTAKTDADGNAIHEDCYALSMKGAMLTPPPENPDNGIPL